MASEITLRKYLERFLAGQISLDELSESVVDAVWDIGPEQDDAVSRFVYGVQMALAERSDGLVSSEAFTNQLVQALMEFRAAQPAHALAS